MINAGFETKLPSIFRVPTVKWNADNSFRLKYKNFKSKEEADAYTTVNGIEKIGVFEVTHTYGNKNALTNNHSYTYRGFDITNFDKSEYEMNRPGFRVQYLMVDIEEENVDRMFHGDRESLGLALDYIDAYLYKLQIGKIKTKRTKKMPVKQPSNVKYAIIHTDKFGSHYLAWQNPAWDDSGYFWTNRKTFMEVLRNSTSEHPFLFNTRREACTWLRLSGITALCKIITIKINKSTVLNDPETDNKFVHPGISADIRLF